MRPVLDRAYCSLRRKEIIRAKLQMKRISVDSLFETLTKGCWNDGIQYEVIIKNQHVLEIKLKGRKEVRLFKYHKTEIVYIEDYENFLLNMEIKGASKGAYITTGIFEENLLRNLRRFYPISKKVSLEDSFKFIERQIGFINKASECLKYNKLKLFKYFPD